MLLAAGESVVAVAERLGHEDASLVLSTYGHLMPDSDDRTRSAVDAAVGRSRHVVCPRCAPGRSLGPLAGELDDDGGVVAGALALALLAVDARAADPGGQGR